MSTTLSTTTIKDIFTVEHLYLAIATGINLTMYGMILTNTEFPEWIQYSSLKIAALLNAPLHLLAVLASVGRFLFNRHRLRRMGLTGVIHAMANVACIVLSYGILLPQLFPGQTGFIFDTMKLQESIVTQVHALSCLVSAVGAAGLLWMISVSKKHLRFFACAIFTSAAIGMGELELVLVKPFSGSTKAMQIIVCIVSTVTALINFIDVWSSFVLVFFERQARPTTKSHSCTPPVVEKHSLISTATQYLPTTVCLVWESFRNADCILHFLPRMDERGNGGRARPRGTSAGHEHAALKPSISWLIYSLGEMGVNTILLCNCFYTGGMFQDIPNQCPTLFNFYGMVTFGITLALKGIISTRTFKLFLAHNLLATSFVNLANAPGLFFDHVGGLIMLGTLVSVTTWQHSEKKSVAATPKALSTA